MKTLKTFILMLLIAAFLYACGAAGGGGTDISVSDVGNVEGTVTDASTGTALSGVTVQVGDKSDVTGDNGVYSIQDIDVGTRTVTASKTGYQNHNGTCEISKGTTVSHDIPLTPNTSSDTTPPTVSSTSPANNATDIAVNSAITVTFSEAMDVSTITTSTFLLEQGNMPISGMVTYSGTTATFTPSANLNYSTMYTATISTGVKDTAGNAMASNYSWSFTTGTASDTTPPTVSSTNPANNTTGVAVNSAITATFSETMDSSTVSTATLTLKQGATAIAGTVTYNGTTATFTPSSNFAYSTTYTATIATGVKDTAGNAMASAYSWSFTTGAAPDTTPPTVSSTNPANGTTGAAVNSAITATFSESMDASTITTSTISLKQGTTPVSGAVTYSGTTATFTPSSSLAYSTTYTATIITGVKDTAGNAMASDYSWSFTTGTAPDTTPPTVSSTSPASNATDVAVNTAITATFSETMDASTVTTATFTLNNGVTSAVTYTGTTATFTPSTSLAYSTSYTATIATGVKDAAGNAMAAAYTWIFTTVAAPQGANFKMPDTGETTGYTSTFGEDSDYTINPPSYTDNGNGTITDNVTGLVWQKQDDGVAKTWAEATTYCDNLSLGAQTGWRLPSRIELVSIVDYGDYTPSINATYFPGTTSSVYWSSTTYASSTSNAWYVTFFDGSTYFFSKTSSRYVRCIRGGQTSASLTDNGNGTVTDNNTNLMWQQGESYSTWEESLSYCEGLTLASYTDWRLPNIKELSSIVYDSTSNPAINATLFPNATSSNYWSSTTYTYPSSISGAWIVDFYGGYTGSYAKTFYNDLRCVRGGQ